MSYFPTHCAISVLLVLSSTSSISSSHYSVVPYVEDIVFGVILHLPPLMLTKHSFSCTGVDTSLSSVSIRLR